ncbi:hypothetical protein MC885_019542 [Smutsia gigantea]|nr:hypothetical protein MC885_019542 [Smutsia gigantea]
MPGRSAGSSSGCPKASGPPSALPVSIKARHSLPGRGTASGVGMGRWVLGPDLASSYARALFSIPTA